MTGLFHSEQRTVDPIKLADVALGAAIRCGADAVYIEPGEQPEETYFVTFERAREVIVSLPIEALSGAATMAATAKARATILLLFSPHIAFTVARRLQ